LLARALAPHAKPQARLEYRLAMDQSAELEGTALTEGAQLVDGYGDLTDLVPTGPDAISVLGQIAYAVRDRLPATRARVDAEILARVPATPGPAVRAAEDAVADVEQVELAPWCEGAQRTACLDHALKKVMRIKELEPDACEPYLLHARALAAGNDAEGGLRELEAAVDRVQDRLPCLRELEGLARELQKNAFAESALRKFVAAGCNDNTDCARSFVWVAQQEDVLGNTRNAFVMYKRAFEYAPDDDGLLQSIADHAVLAGLHAEAADDYRRLALKHPNDNRWRTAQEQERLAAVKGAAGL
jgi:tetratricopeptide (TPR) repeat protein